MHYYSTDITIHLTRDYRVEFESEDELTIDEAYDLVFRAIRDGFSSINWDSGCGRLEFHTRDGRTRNIDNIGIDLQDEHMERGHFEMSEDILNEDGD